MHHQTLFSLSTMRMVFLVYLLSSIVLLVAVDGEAPTAYEMLEQYGFPKGILPEGVQSYILRLDSSFEVTLRSDCQYKVPGGGGGYLLKYKRKITGRLASGALTELRGVSVRVLRLWFGIDGVVMREAYTINFYIGPLSASYPAASFKECPQCLRRVGCKGGNAVDS